MTAFTIKLIAIITMVIDHIGLFFFPDLIWFRVVGRLAFPLFAWLIANGAYHTHNIKAYLARIFILACISQIPFLLANRQMDPQFSNLNVLFTLSLGLAAIIFIKKVKSPLFSLFIAAGFALAANLLNTDYGAMGVFSIIAFYVFFKNIKYLLLSEILIFTIPYIGALEQLDLRGSIEVVGIFSLIIIAFYNQKEGRKMKYLFYLFYPVQYILIYLAQILLK